jgi:hypothetical protein
MACIMKHAWVDLWVDELECTARKKCSKALLVPTVSSANMFGFKSNVI